MRPGSRTDKYLLGPSVVVNLRAQTSSAVDDYKISVWFGF